MGFIVTLAMAGLLMAPQGSAQHSPSPDRRAAFRQSVEDYQMFVVPHCAPDDVHAYVSARADRDRTFVRSLRHSVLAADYAKAVADRAAVDGRTMYECFGPPPPPPPPGTILVPPQPTPDANLIAQEYRRALAEHFAGGDAQFAEMKRLRDEVITRNGK